MKQQVLALFIACLSSASFSSTQAQEPIWLQQYGNSRANLGLRLAYDGQGGVYGVGSIAGPSLEMDGNTVSTLGSGDILIAKWDTTGVLIWARADGGICQDELESGSSIIHDALSGHVIVSGQFECSLTYFGDHTLTGSENNGQDRFIAAYDDVGECLWARSATGFDFNFNKLLADDASRVFVFGSSRTAWITFHGPANTSLPPGGFIARYNSNGTMLTARRVVVNGELAEAGWASTDEWILTGMAKPNASLYNENLAVQSALHDGFVAKCDTTGVVQWTTMFPSNGSSSIWRVAILPDGRSAVSGYFVDDLLLPNDTLSGTPGIWTFFIALLSPDGTVEWAVPISGGEGAVVSDIKADVNGDVLIYGRYESALSLGSYTLAPYASTSGFVARFSPVGECKAAWGFGRTYYGSGSILTTDHGLYLSSEFDSTLVLGSYSVQGTYTGTDQGYHDLFIARFDSLSGFTGVLAMKTESGERLHIYANPNNGLCTIELPASIKPGSDLMLTIHDAMGRVVQQAPLRWSEGAIQLDIRAQARGVYHAELLDGRQRYSGTIIFE
jgi:hypothetical protein